MNTMTHPRASLPCSRRTCAALLVVLLIAPIARGADAKPSLQSQAVELFNSLTPEQRKQFRQFGPRWLEVPEGE